MEERREMVSPTSGEEIITEPVQVVNPEPVINGGANGDIKPVKPDPLVRWDNKFMGVERFGESTVKPNIVY